MWPPSPRPARQIRGYPAGVHLERLPDPGQHPPARLADAGSGAAPWTAPYHSAAAARCPPSTARRKPRHCDTVATTRQGASIRPRVTLRM
jgi:hypothetical protein